MPMMQPGPRGKPTKHSRKLVETEGRDKASYLQEGDQSHARVSAKRGGALSGRARFGAGTSWPTRHKMEAAFASSLC